MTKRIILFFLLLPYFAFANQVIIKGKIQYVFKGNIEISRFSAIDLNKTIISTAKIKEDSTFHLEFNLDESEVLDFNGSPMFFIPGEKVRIDILSRNNFKVQYKYPGDLIYFKYFLNFEKPSTNHIKDIQSLRDFDSNRVSDSLSFNTIFNAFDNQYKTSTFFKKYYFELHKSFWYASIHQAMARLKISFEDDYFKKYKTLNFSPEFKRPFNNNYYRILITGSHNDILFQKIPKPTTLAELKDYLNTCDFYYPKDEAILIKLNLFNYFCKNPLTIKKEVLDNFYLTLKPQVTKYGSTKLLDKNYNDFKLIGSKISSQILDVNIINTDKVSKTFKTILEENPKKLIFIDFWASWCGPCIQEFQHISEYHQSLEKDKLVFISLSLDEKFDTWTASNKKHGLNWGSYFLEGGFNSTLAKEYITEGIPRFMIFNSNLEIEAVTFKTPSHPSFKIEIEKLLNSK